VSDDAVPANGGMRSRGVGVSRGSKAEERNSDASATPQLTVLSKNTSPEEVAALVVALAALRPMAAPAPAPRSRWADPARSVRPRYSHGPGGWQASGQPR
jgi:hypothetical protein